MKASGRKNFWGFFLVPVLLVFPSTALADSIDSVLDPNLGFGPAIAHSTATLGKAGKPVSGLLPFVPGGDYEGSKLEVAIESFNNRTRLNSADSAAGFDLSLANRTAGESGSNEPSNEMALNEPVATMAPAMYADSGQNYWLGVSPLSGASNGAWQFSYVGGSQPWSFNTSLTLECPVSLSCAMVPNPSGRTSQSRVTAAATVIGDTVTTPEPSLLFLVATGTLLLALAKAMSAKSR